MRFLEQPLINLTIVTVAFLALNFFCSKNIILEDEKKAVEQLAALYEIDNWEIRKNAVAKVSAFRSQSAELLLLKACDDVYTIVRIEAIKGLGKFNSLRARGKLKKLAESEQIDNVRWYAIRSLAKYREPTSAPIFVKCMTSKDWLIREEAIKGLLTIDDPLIKQLSVPYIIKALEDTSVNVKISAIKLMNIKDIQIYKKLENIINDNKNINKVTLLQAALKAIDGYIIYKNTRETMIKLLTHPNSKLRVLALTALKKDKKLRLNRRNS